MGPMAQEPAVPRLELDDHGELVGARVENARHAAEVFARSRLVDVELVRCDLSGCDFSEATWDRVRCVDCRASSIDLGLAALREVTFLDCKLDTANLRLTKLRNVRFDSCVLGAAEFVNAQMERVTFFGSDLRGVNVSKVRCTEVDLRGARLDGIAGAGALEGATITADQLFALAPALAAAVGIAVRDE
jgi:uncharacterized protein YjbI with pentapeptide repeats